MTKKSLLFIILFLLLALLASLFLVFRSTSIFTKASTRSTASLTLENSYLFASPIQAKADGQELVRITVFLLDGRGLGVSGHTVELLLPTTVSVTALQAVTDDTGKATFNVSSTTAQRARVSAKVNSQKVAQSVTVVFN